MALVLEELRAKRLARQMKAVERSLVEHALEREVVDREHNGRLGPAFAHDEPRVDHRERRMPVVRVHDIGPALPRARGNLERAPRHHREAQLVVTERAVRVSVDARAREEGRVVEQADATRSSRRKARGLELQDPRVTHVGRTPAEPNTDGARPPRRPPRNARHAVERRDHDDVLPALGERQGQRLDHVTEPSRSRERLDLRGDHQDSPRPCAHCPGAERTRRRSQPSTAPSAVRISVGTTCARTQWSAAACGQRR